MAKTFVGQTILDVWKILRKTYQLSLGYEVDPKVISGTDPVTPDNGCVFYCIKPIGGDIVIASAKDAKGTAISWLAGVTILEADEFKIRLSEIDLTSGTAVGYQKLLEE